MGTLIKVMLISFIVKWASSSLHGSSYMDSLLERNREKQEQFLRKGDPCHPLYWYPRAIPAHCNDSQKKKRESESPSVPIPLPIPVPAPMPAPLPVPPLPYGIPIQPSSPMIPMPAQSYAPFGYLAPYMGYPSYPMPPPPPPMVPGIPGMVSPDGGINIMPFSDVYSDVIEKHNRRKLIKEMKKIYEKYAKKSWKNYHYKDHDNRPYDFE